MTSKASPERMEPCEKGFWMAAPGIILESGWGRVGGVGGERGRED